MSLFITQTIFVPIRATVQLVVFEVIDVALILHFKIDADSAIEWRLGTEDVQVVDTSFNDLCNDVSSLLITSDSDFRGMACIE